MAQEIYEAPLANWSGFGPDPKQFLNEKGERLAVISTDRTRFHFLRPVTFDELAEVVHFATTLQLSKPKGNPIINPKHD